MRGMLVFMGLAAASCIGGPAKPPQEMQPAKPVEQPPPNVVEVGTRGARSVGTGLRWWTAERPPASATTPEVSADGSFFLYASDGASNGFQVYLRRPPEPAARRLTFHDADHLFPRLSPDGARVAYASAIDGNFNIYVASLAAPGQVQQVTTSAQDELAPAWAPDGNRLAFMRQTPEGGWQIWTAEVHTRTTALLGPGRYPDWGRDADGAEWILFQSGPDAHGRARVERMRPDGTEREVVVASPQWSALTPRWVPGGKWILYTRRSEGDGLKGEAVHMIRPDGTRDTELWREQGSTVWWPSMGILGDGGGRLFFASRREEADNIFSIEVSPAVLEVEP